MSERFRGASISQWGAIQTQLPFLPLKDLPSQEFHEYSSTILRVIKRTSNQPVDRRDCIYSLAAVDVDAECLTCVECSEELRAANVIADDVGGVNCLVLERQYVVIFLFY